jgi:ABC-type uncharacterized transport system permease subunit
MKTQRIINNVIIVLVVLCLVIFDAAGLMASLVEKGTAMHNVLMKFMACTLTYGFPFAFMSCAFYDKNANEVVE